MEEIKDDVFSDSKDNSVLSSDSEFDEEELKNEESKMFTMQRNGKLEKVLKIPNSKALFKISKMF